MIQTVWSTTTPEVNSTMSKITVTALQIPVSDYIDTNYKTLKRNLIAHKTSDWILTPECSLSGYCQPPVIEKMDQRAEQRYFERLEELEDFQATQRAGFILGTGHVERDGLPYNQARVYNRDGHLISTYNKQLLCRGPNGGGETKYYLPGYEPSYFYADTNQEFLASTLICNDAWGTPRVTPGGNPQLGWQLGRQGVAVLFVLANCNVHTFDPIVYAYHESVLRQMARDNSMWVVVSNSSLAMGMGPQDVYPKDRELEFKAIDRVQLTSGIIAPNGDWAAWCDDSGEDSVTMEIDLGVQHNDFPF